jgi:hypothetical protein
MTPQSAISMLTRQLDKHGEDVELRRVSGTAQIPFSCTVRAVVRGYAPDELVGGIDQGSSRVILSPREIEASGWPGPGIEGASAQDRRVPIKGDKCKIEGKVRNVDVSTPIYLAGELVRIELRVTG